ncbi:hypothetical protein [Streptomyces sp. NPDC005907]
MARFVNEDGTLRDVTPEDLERLTDTINRVFARMQAAGAVLVTSNVDEVA